MTAPTSPLYEYEKWKQIILDDEGDEVKFVKDEVHGQEKAMKEGGIAGGIAIQTAAVPEGG